MEFREDIQRDMSITLSWRWGGWMGTVNFMGADMDNRKRHQDPQAALDESLELYEQIIQGEIERWDEP